MFASDPVVNRGEQTGSHQVQKAPQDAVLGTGHKPGNDLDLSTVLLDFLSTAAGTVGADSGFILVLDEGGWPSHWYVLSDGRGRFESPIHARAMVERGVVSRVIQHQRGELVDDLQSDAHWLHLSRLYADAVWGSALCLPLLVYQRATGVLVLVHKERDYFRADHLSMLESSADRAALSIENARLYETVRRRAEEMAALYEVALNVSADQPLERLLDTIIAQAMDLLHGQGGGVFLWREDVAALELVAAFDPEIDLRGKRVALGEEMVGRVFETGAPLVLDEYEEWRIDMPHAGDAGITVGLPAVAAIAVPLVWQGQSLGVLVTTDRTPGRHFDHNDQRMLTLLANQAAAAIASVQLHEQTSRRLQELTFLNRTIQDITATLDLDEIFAVLTRRVKDMLEIEACSIALVDREGDELVFRAASGGGAEVVIGQRVPWGEGIVGAAAQTGEPVNVVDVRRDERFYQEIDKKQTEFVTHTILAVPMISQGKVVGVVEGLNKPGGFDTEDERLLGALASLAASVVANADLISARRELERLREDLIHMIVHDLRSPVGTVSNSLEMLQTLLGDRSTDQAAHLIDIAARATRRLLNMVDSLLDISRLEAGQELTNRLPTSIQTLIGAAVDQVELYARRKRIRLRIEYPDSLPLVLADAGMIERVLVNLIGNALKFSPSDSDVDVSVDAEEDVVRVQVRDSGPGIPPEHQQRVFDKFVRIKDQEGMGGAGLGLAFCRLAVQAHGGRIWVKSASGKGSTFVFTLPIVKLSRGSKQKV